jgi:hypothetical protein
MKTETSIKLPTEITKFDIIEFIETINGYVNNGQAEALPIYVKAKAMAKAMDGVIASLEQQAMEEAMRHSGKTFDFMSAQITKKEGAEYPDFNEDAEIVKLKQAVKDREDLLKMAFRNRDKAAILHPDTGEIIPVLKPKSYKSSLTIQFI